MPAIGNGYVVATSPHRVVNKAANRGIQKYGQKRTDGKFKWVTNLRDASIFTSMSTVLQYMGLRATKLRRGPTTDLIILQVQTSPPVPVSPLIQVVGTLNG